MRLMLVGCLAVACLLGAAAQTLAAPPPMPYTAYGTVTLDGRPAPNGTLITAWIGGVQYAQMRTIDGWYATDVPGDDAESPGQKEGGASGDVVTFKVNGLLAPQRGTWESGSAVRMNLTASSQQPTLQFSAQEMTVSEGGVSATITVTLSSPSPLPVTVGYVTAEGTAAAALDYTGGSGTLTLNPGETSATFAVAIINDSLDEADEMISFVLHEPSNATLGTPASASLVIHDDDPPPTVQFSAGAYRASEGARTATITVTLSAVSAKSASIACVREVGVQMASQRLRGAAYEVSFAPGQVSQMFELEIVDDALDEGDEALTFALSEPSNAVLGVPARATLTIVDDDPSPSIQFATDALRFNEGAGRVEVGIVLNAPSGRPITVTYGAIPGTATAGSDYVSLSGTLRFLPGETAKPLVLEVLDDAVHEPSEMLVMALSNPVNATLGATASAWVAIADDDPSVISAVTPSAVTAGGPGFELVVLGSGFVSGDSVVQWNGSDRPTTFVSGERLAAEISSADIATAGSVSITVRSSGSCLCLSNAAVLNVLVPAQHRMLRLSVGWNLLSLPLVPASSVITEVLSSIAGHYDLVYSFDAADASRPWKKYSPTAPAFLNTLMEIDPRSGLWIRAQNAVTLTLAGNLSFSGEIALRTGWNLVGYPAGQAQPVAQALASIAGDYDLVYAYDPADTLHPWGKFNPTGPSFLNTLTEMQPGKGYWIRAVRDTVWRVP